MISTDSINYRLLQLIDLLGLSKGSFANRIGVSSALVSKITTKEINFGSEILVKIVEAFPEVNVSWLLIGSGKIFLDATMPVEEQTIRGLSREFFIDFKLNRMVPLQDELVDLFNLSNYIRGKSSNYIGLKDIDDVFKPLYKRIDNLISKSTTEVIDQEVAHQLHKDLIDHERKYQNRRREIFQDLRFQITDGILSKRIIINK